jgi:hypothetical protein
VQLKVAYRASQLVARSIEKQYVEASAAPFPKQLLIRIWAVFQLIIINNYFVDSNQIWLACSYNTDRLCFTRAQLNAVAVLQCASTRDPFQGSHQCSRLLLTFSMKLHSGPLTATDAE